MTNATAKNDAGTAYRTHQNDIARLIDVLQMELDAHAEGKQTWGDVGELGGIRSGLIDTVSAISGASREELEAFLNDAI
jgi:hypothetical protein